MEFEILSTERLLLRKLTPEGFKYIFENYSKDEIKAQLGLSTDEEFIKEKQKSDGGYKTYDRSIAHFKLIVKETNEVIGGGGFHNWYAAHSKAELGYVLNKEEHKRKGYMSEAVSTLLEYGFHSMQLNRIEACIGPANIASLSLIRKFGFTQEGYLRKHFTRDGEVQDSIIFSLLREEYEGMKTN
jgi:ribosomal-protein-alanine N-acetyltransferase